MTPENIELPNTDSPEVMQQAVSVYLMNLIWEELSRTVDPEKVDERVVDTYERVYSEVRRIHGGG